MKITSTKPRKCGAILGYAVHSATVMVRGAAAEMLARCAAAVAGDPWVTPHATAAGVWVVRSPSKRIAGGADLEAVDATRRKVVARLTLVALEDAPGAPAKVTP